MIRFTPINDKLLVRRNKEDEKVGSLYVADIAQEKPSIGVVLAVGPGKYEKEQLIPMAVKDGDTIAYGKYAGTEIKIDSEDFLILREEEVFGIMQSVKSKARVA